MRGWLEGVALVVIRRTFCVCLRERVGGGIFADGFVFGCNIHVCRRAWWLRALLSDVAFLSLNQQWVIPLRMKPCL